MMVMNTELAGSIMICSETKGTKAINWFWRENEQAMWNHGMRKVMVLPISEEIVCGANFPSSWEVCIWDNMMLVSCYVQSALCRLIIAV